MIKGGERTGGSKVAKELDKLLASWEHTDKIPIPRLEWNSLPPDIQVFYHPTDMMEKSSK